MYKLVNIIWKTKNTIEKSNKEVKSIPITHIQNFCTADFNQCSFARVAFALTGELRPENWTTTSQLCFHHFIKFIFACHIWKLPPTPLSRPFLKLVPYFPIHLRSLPHPHPLSGPSLTFQSTSTFLVCQHKHGQYDSKVNEC